MRRRYGRRLRASPDAGLSDTLAGPTSDAWKYGSSPELSPAGRIAESMTALSRLG